MKRLFPLLLLSAGACTTVGPDYAPPAADTAGEWLEPADTSPVDPRWWVNFGDPQLTALIESALEQSPGLAEARARLAEARANRDAVVGRTLPQLSASGSATENRLSENGQFPLSNIPNFDPEFSLFDLGFDASWELDFWGRNARQAEAAWARVGAAEAARDGVIVTLTGEIARTYFDLRGAQADLTAARQASDAQAQLARLTQLRFSAGDASRIETEEAAANAANAREAVAGAEARAAAAAYRIAALMGRAPEEVVPPLLEPEPVADAPETILTGLRSDLLRRRPDIRRAERELAAATADIGVATADLFPRFSLMGGIGSQAQTVEDLANDGSLRFSIGPSFSWPIFSGGTIRARIRAADARAEAALARYSAAVAEALADSEGAINRFLRAREGEDAAMAAAARQHAAFALAQRRFEAGEDNRLALERARLALQESKRRAAAARADTARAAVAVYKALGGAWQVRSEPSET